MGRPPRKLLMIERPLFLTLPTETIIPEVINRKHLSLRQFIHWFYLFRFYILKDYSSWYLPLHNLFFDNDKVKNYYLLQNTKKHEKHYYIANILWLRSFFLKKTLYLKSTFIVKNLKQLRFMAIKDQNRGAFGKLFFYQVREQLILFDDFKFRVPIVFYLAFGNLAQYIKAYKYNEYLNRTCNLYYYPLLRVVLRGVSRRFRPSHRAFKKTERVILTTWFYFAPLGFVIPQEKVRGWIQYDLKGFIVENRITGRWNPNNISLFYNGNAFLKLLRFERKAFPVLSRYIRLPFLNSFFFFMYEIWAQVEKTEKEYANRSALNSHKWRIFYFFHLYWFLDKYDDDLPHWMFMLASAKICQVLARTTKTRYNNAFLSTILTNQYSELANRRLCLIAAKKIIFLVELHDWFKIFYKMALRLTRGNAARKKWRLIWTKFLECYPMTYKRGFIDHYSDNDRLLAEMKERLYYSDMMHWKIFYGGNFHYHTDKLDMLRTSKRLRGDFVVIPQYKDFILALKSFYQDDEGEYVSRYFFTRFLHDLFFNFMMKKFRIYYIKYIYKEQLALNHINYYFKFIVEANAACKGFEVYWKYFHINRDFFLVQIGRGTCVAMCINIVTYSFKVDF